MPTYEYRCRQCRHELEVYQSFDEAALTECPECGGALGKKFGSVGIAFKGSGFYKNDSRSAGGNGESGSTSTTTSSESGSGSKAAPSSAASTDSTSSSEGSDTKKAAPATSAPSNSSASE